MDRPTIINKDSLVPIGLVLSMLVAAISFGALWQRVDNLTAQMAEVQALRQDIASIKVDVAVIKERVVAKPLSAVRP